MSLFCRHNRFMAECPICAKGTVLDPNRTPARRPRPRAAGGRTPPRSPRAAAAGGARASRGPFASAGPYDDGREVRLEKVPGGLRLAAWQAGRLVKDAPVVEVGDLPALLAATAEKGVADLRRPERGEDRAGSEPAIGAHGASPGRTGELRDELRVERLDEDRVRIARWVLRPNRGWELQEAPVLLPAERFAGALAAAADNGALWPSGS